MPARRILIATFGSLGDLHPYIALARALQRRGHAPLIATLERYRAAVEAQGVNFAPMRPGDAELPDLEKEMERLFDPRRGPEYLARMVMPFARAAHEDLSRLAADADLLVTHPLAVAGPLIAEQTGMPWVSTVLAPMSLLSCYDPPLFPPAPWMLGLRRLGVAPYRALFGLAKWMVRPWEAPLRELRTELGLPPSNKLALFEGQYSPRLNLALFSPLLAARQPDWPANTKVCGFARHDGAALDAATQARLDGFLAAGELPIVFALGSSAVKIAGDFWNQAIAASRALGRRALLITGQAPQDWGDIISFDYLPYSAVFPHACAVVHQAGIGTLSQALAAGRPQLIVPVAFDQPDNALRTARLGVARVLPFRKVTVAGLKQQLGLLLGDTTYAQRAEDVGIQVREENGGAHAAQCIEAVTPTEYPDP